MYASDPTVDLYVNTLFTRDLTMFECEPLDRFTLDSKLMSGNVICYVYFTRRYNMGTYL